MNGPNPSGISIRDFVASDYLSKSNLHFVGESNNDGSLQPLVSPEGGPTAQSSEKMLHSLNASKLALLLAKTFVKLGLHSYTHDGNVSDISSLQLDNFFVRLSLDDVKCNGHETADTEAEVDELELLASAVLDDPEQGGNDISFTCQSNQSNPSSATTTTASSPNLSENTWTLHDIYILPSTNCIPDQGRLSPMQILGKHIQAIFSPMNHQLSSGLTKHTQNSDNYDASVQHPPKLRMLDNNSLFFTLVETQDYPVSVCRLISDMVDVGNGGKSEHPFTTFDDVIDDLEQMTSHPQIYLHDPDNDFFSSNLQFGQRCFGRTKELTKLLDISTRLEQYGQGQHQDGFNNELRLESPVPPDVSNAVFVSGVAGSGKSHFVENVCGFLENLGWIVQKEKFKRNSVIEAKEIVSSLFDKLVGTIVQMKIGSNKADSDYSLQATEAISNALDASSLNILSNFIPSLLELIPGVEQKDSLPTEAEQSNWQLVFLLSKFLEALLSLNRCILLFLDDLQWCEESMLMLIREIITNVGQNEGSHHFLFVGIYRDNEITDLHPFSSALQENINVHITEIKLSSLSKDDVTDMIMSEVRLPRRLVSKLADIVHRRTGGHAFFVASLLNSLVRDNTIAYSPRRHRFDWDENQLLTLKTPDSVASLIVSNLSHLEKDALKSLRVLSCFGVQIPISLLKLLGESSCSPEGGIESFLPGLVERCVIEVRGSSVYFCHDLIQQGVHESCDLEERQMLHLSIGNHIASKIGLESSFLDKSVEVSLSELELDESNSNGIQESASPSYPLIAIATNQINFAGPKAVSDRVQQLRYSRWNLCAANHAVQQANYQAARYYFQHGIKFLGDNLWRRENSQLCMRLFEGDSYVSFAVGNHHHAVEQAKIVIDHVAFDDSLEAQYIMIRSLDSLGRYADAITKGISILRELKFDIPSSDPSPTAVMEMLNVTGKNASAYSFEQITTTSPTINVKRRSIFKLVGALVVSGFRISSPYLPLIGCAATNYSLQNGICVESINAFLLMGYFKAALEKNYEESRYWGNVVYKILENTNDKSTNSIVHPVVIRSDAMVTMYVNSFYYPWKQTAFRLLKLYQRANVLGDRETALYALHFSLSLSFYSGEKLSLVVSSQQELIKSMLSHVKEGAKLAVLNKIMIDDLIGNSTENFSDFGGIIVDEDSLLADAKARNNKLLVEGVHLRRFMSAFWSGEYAEANKWSKEISLSLGKTNQIKIPILIYTFYKGLIAFQKYRDGGGEGWLDEGKKVYDEIGVWLTNSPANFSNKLLLLEGEYQASLCNIVAAKTAYEASVRSARDQGFVHEQGLGCELYGKFLSSIVETNEAFIWLKCAHACYMQWGAIAKAERVWNDHNLGLSNSQFPPDMTSNMKRKNR